MSDLKDTIKSDAEKPDADNSKNIRQQIEDDWRRRKPRRLVFRQNRIHQYYLFLVSVYQVLVLSFFRSHLKYFCHRIRDIGWLCVSAITP